ncbi:MAG: hypothetical protein WBL06_09585 [Pseudolysinimonas sp.]|uniref:hypothetical protein n=1 Tax=Pseudolysinimonas sp. TaxID=2680009 RepID=UPI003C781C1E
MRFVVAIVALVLAAAAIGLGVAQRTVFAGPASISSSVVTGDAPLTVIDAATLNANAGTQSIELAADGEIVLAYGRTSDVLAWVGEASYNEISWDAESLELTTQVVQGSETAAEVPSIAGSDLWLREFTGTDVLTRKINAPEGISVIIGVDPIPADGTEVTDEAPVESTEDGAEAAEEPSVPVDVSITWPLDNSAPASGPLIVGGIVLLLVGLGAFLWALVNVRGSRGPRRSTPKLPKRPKPPQLKPDKRRGGKPTPELEPAKSGSGRRRAFVAAGSLTVAGLLLSGCTVGVQPAPGASPTPDFETTPVAVTSGQFATILVDVVDTVADADATADATLATERLTGPALALRTANYTIRAADSAVAPLAAIPSEIVEVVLPEQTDSWPRRVFAVTRDTGVQAVGIMLTQESPRENYKASYVVTLIASVPNVAPPELGAPALPPSNGFGLLPPEELAAAYGDVLINGDDSEFADLFEADGDALREQIGADYKTQRRAELPSSATIEFANGPGDDPVVAFNTNDSGQLVAAVLEDVETVTPVEAGAAVNPAGQVKALSGKTQSTRGIVATYGVQLLFYVPPAGATDQKIIVLGYAQGLVAATEIP